jgi:hypothetical protein
VESKEDGSWAVTLKGAKETVRCVMCASVCVRVHHYSCCSLSLSLHHPPLPIERNNCVCLMLPSESTVACSCAVRIVRCNLMHMHWCMQVAALKPLSHLVVEHLPITAAEVRPS